MKTFRNIFTSAFMLATMVLNAQKLKIYEGDKTLAFLKTETMLNLDFDYKEMMVGNRTEAEYIQDKKTDFNKKTPGKGDRWEERWNKNKEVVYEPKFEELLSEMLMKSKSELRAARRQSNSKYTMLVKTTKLEPGYNAVVSKQDPYCDYEIWFIETATKNVVAKGKLKFVVGIVVFDNDWDFDPSGRIKECYAKAGKVCGKLIGKATAAKK